MAEYVFDFALPSSSPLLLIVLQERHPYEGRPGGRAGELPFFTKSETIAVDILIYIRRRW